MTCSIIILISSFIIYMPLIEYDFITQFIQSKSVEKKSEEKKKNCKDTQNQKLKKKYGKKVRNSIKTLEMVNGQFPLRIIKIRITERKNLWYLKNMFKIFELQKDSNSRFSYCIIVFFFLLKWALPAFCFLGL